MSLLLDVYRGVIRIEGMPVVVLVLLFVMVAGLPVVIGELALLLLGQARKIYLKWKLCR